LGILGTVTVTRNKKTGRLNRWGKWALSLTIAGFATALLSEVAQQFKEHHDIIDAQARIERQIAVQKVTLNRVERILTRFDAISFSVRYELNTNNVFFASLYDYVNDWIPANLTNSSDSPTNSGSYSVEVAGYSNERTFSVLLSSDSAQISLPSKKTLQRYSTSLVSSQDFNSFYSFLNNPSFAFAVYATNRDYSQTPDLYLTTTNLNKSPTLGHDFSSGKLFIEWSFDCPKAGWKQSKRMTSLPDLANSHLYLSCLNPPFTIAASLMPLSTETTFDVMTLRLYNFSRVILGPVPPSELESVSEIPSNSPPESTTGFSSGDAIPGLSEFGSYKISGENLFSASFPDEETILNLQ